MPEEKPAKITIEREGDDTIVLENVSQCALVAICVEGGIKPMDKSHFMGDPFLLIGRLTELQERMRFTIQQGAVAEVFKQIQKQQMLQQQVQGLNLKRDGNIIR